MRNKLIISALIAFWLLPIGVGAETTSTPTTTSALSSSTIRDYVAEATSTIEKARAFGQNVGNAVSSASKIYEEAKGVTANLRAVITRGEEIYLKLQPAKEKFLEIWNKVTNNNDQTRVVIILGAVALIAIIIRFI